MTRDMEPDDQSKIPTTPLTVMGAGGLSQDEQLTDSAISAALGAGRSKPSPGAWQPPTPEELQRDFPQYEIRGILGRGGMGAVYKGWQRNLDRFVAIKILPPGIDDNVSDFTERFKREAKAMAHLHHPGIVAVHDAGETPDGLLYFIMECVEGTDVQQLVSERKRLAPGEALRITSDVCDALAYAHAHGVIHRDIKPSNIMLDGRGTVKVADFGLAKSTAPETTVLTQSNVTMGTPDFMAPEALHGVANVDHRADIFAVGVMLYRMLTGKLPRGKYDPPSRVVPGLDKRLDHIVDRALQPEPAARYSSATELRTAMIPVALSIARRASAGTGTAASRKKPALILLPLIVVVAAIAALVHLAPWKSKPPRVVPPVVKHPAGEVWHDWITESETQGNLPKEIIKETDGYRVAAATLGVRFQTGFAPASLRDMAILISYLPPKDGPDKDVGLMLRQTPDAFWCVTGKGTDPWRIERLADGKATELFKVPRTAEINAGGARTVELRFVGETLTVLFNGKVVGTGSDPTPARGSIGFDSPVGTLLLKVEWADLGGPTAAATVQNFPAIATKDKPFVNMLGMEFVPVRGTHVLFCRWETRVRDYAAYAQTNNVDEAWTQVKMDGVPLPNGPEYPACGVDWDAANAFCEWLTEKETAEGRLPKGMMYRLPTDEEWSRAVGLGKEKGSTPKEKSGKNTVNFPWGTSFPPKDKAGNYADSAFHEKFPKQQNKWIEGYTDGFAMTAPAGSFMPNEYGIYDLGGNVWEWCEDLYEPGDARRVARGASWGHYEREGLLSSYRRAIAPESRLANYGFRCVLDVSAR
jgi:hypothetical protein